MIRLTNLWQTKGKWAFELQPAHAVLSQDESSTRLWSDPHTIAAVVTSTQSGYMLYMHIGSGNRT